MTNASHTSFADNALEPTQPWPSAAMTKALDTLAQLDEPMADAIRTLGVAEGIIVEHIPDVLGVAAGNALIRAKSDLLALSSLLVRDLRRSHDMLGTAWQTLLDNESISMRRRVESETVTEDHAFEDAAAEYERLSAICGAATGDAAIDLAADDTIPAFRRVMEAPTRTLRNLKRKIEILRKEHGDMVPQEYLEGLLADLDPFLPPRAAPQGAETARGAERTSGNTTRGFQDARKTQSVAMAYLEGTPDEEVDTPDYKVAEQAEQDAFEALLAYPAITPAEVGIKLDHFLEREVYMWETKGDVIDAIKADLIRLERCPVSADMHKALADWRAVHKTRELDCEDCDDAKLQILDAFHTTMYNNLLKTPSIGAGDATVKAYVNLLGQLGNTRPAKANADLIGNIFDVDIENADNPIDHNELWQRSLYADLDACEMGMHLLSYGRPEFSATEWMKGAVACGLQINVLPAPSGHPGGNIALALADEDDLDPRIARERDRLRRILAGDMDHRHGAVVEVICRDWPHLVLSSAQVLRPANPI